MHIWALYSVVAVIVVDVVVVVVPASVLSLVVRCFKSSSSAYIGTMFSLCDHVQVCASGSDNQLFSLSLCFAEFALVPV